MNALVALPDNQHALSGSRDNTVKLFNVNDGTVLRNFRHHDPGPLLGGPIPFPLWGLHEAGGVTSLALLPDGLRFVSGSGDCTARIVYHGLAPL